MRHFVLRAWLVAAVALALSSCSDDNDDAIGGACHVVVEQCGDVDSMSECIDVVGTFSAECIDCIRRSGCDYATCQASVAGCRLPVAWTAR